MEPSSTSPAARFAPDLVAEVQRAIAAAPGRIRRVEIGQAAYWVKQRETLPLRLRLQKGDPARAFEAERAALHTLAGTNLPVAPIVAEGSDFFATADQGPTLSHLLKDTTVPESLRIEAFAAAGRGLAAFHAKGRSHGRPSIRDICWDGTGVTFIDLERYRPRRNTLSGHAQDLIMFVLSAYTVTGAEQPEIDAACAAYRAAAPAEVWPRAQIWCRRLRWINALTRPLQSRPGRHPEFRAIPLTLRRFGAI